MQMIQLELPLATVNAALTALASFPYKEAAPHIAAIQNAAQHANPPVEAAPAVTESEVGNAD